jgi:mRNA-degrading endonuclease RelE of RelBE toxin-antitoxin system
MKIVYHPNFKKALKKFSLLVQNKFEKQITYLVKNIRHPSLHAKKYDESLDLWQARVDKNVRFYFVIKNDVYVLVDIKYHPK